MKRTTLLLWFIWITCAFCYYGVVLMTTEFLQAENGCKALDENTQNEQCYIACNKLQTNDYIDLLWTTLAEFPGIFVTIFIIEKIGRKKTMAAEFFIFTLFVCLLFICPSQYETTLFSFRRFFSAFTDFGKYSFLFLLPSYRRVLLTLFLFGARGIVSGVFQAAYVYTPEVYPTSIRAIGVGTCSGMARIGAMITPFVAQVLLKTSVPLAIGLYALMAVVAGIATLMLPIETKGQKMREHAGS